MLHDLSTVLGDYGPLYRINLSPEPGYLIGPDRDRLPRRARGPEQDQADRHGRGVPFRFLSLSRSYLCRLAPNPLQFLTQLGATEGLVLKRGHIGRADGVRVRHASRQDESAQTQTDPLFMFSLP